ncbi:MAG TPA: hypothetical protein VLY04_01360 [Bryobacteraceae bacterium]|nr:hypothetical protein [Bryobacteraceae bacterium]
MRKNATLRELHLRTGAILSEVSDGKTFVIQRKGVAVAELRPVGRQLPTARMPDREAFFRSLPRDKSDSGRMLEQDRT